MTFTGTPLPLLEQRVQEGDDAPERGADCAERAAHRGGGVSWLCEQIEASEGDQRPDQQFLGHSHVFLLFQQDNSIITLFITFC